MNRTTRLKKPQIPELDTLYQFNDLGGRPKYGGVEMTSETDIPSFQEIMDETHSAVVAEATARDDADDALQAQIDSLDSDLTAETAAREAADQAEATARAAADQAETTARTSADNNLQTQIDAIVASSDVKDIVGTYAELQAYDTSTLGDNDIIKVLQDETHQDETTYYRWVLADEEFSLIGEEGPYYTKAATDALLNNKADKATTYTKTETDAALSLKADKATTYTKTETDTLLGGKQDTLTAGDNITIDANNVISAEAGVTKLTTADYNYPTDNPTQIAAYLLGDGIYNAADVPVYLASYQEYGLIIVESLTSTLKTVLVYNGAGPSAKMYYMTAVNSVNKKTSLLPPTVVQTTGTSTSSVMSQNAATSMVFADPGTTQKVQIGNSASAGGNNSVAVGYGASSGGTAATAIGRSANSEGMQSTAIGFESVARGTNAVALGHSATASTSKDGTISIGASAGANSGNASYSTQIGYFARATSNGGIALGSYSSASDVGEMNIGSSSTTYGYNNSNYRRLSGVYDPQSAHDAATKGYVDTAVAGAGASYYSNSELESLWEGGV